MELVFRSWSTLPIRQTPSSLGSAGLRDRDPEALIALEVLAAVSVAAVRGRCPCSRVGDICGRSS